jgi:large subunit ribosomal protein L29
MPNKKVEFNTSLRGMNHKDLTARIQEEELRLKKLEFAHAISPLENPMTIRSVRKDIARLKTELKKKAIVA